MFALHFRFFYSNWAIIDMVSNFFTLGWLGWYITLALEDRSRDKVRILACSNMHVLSYFLVP